jgi:hypothetical protein
MGYTNRYYSNAWRIASFPERGYAPEIEEKTLHDQGD